MNKKEKKLREDLNFFSCLSRMRRISSLMTKSQKIERALEKIRKDTFAVEYRMMDGGMYYVVDVYVDEDKARFIVPAGGTIEDIVNRIMVEVNNHTISDKF